MTKLTYAMAIDSAINGNVTDEVREKLEALKTQLAKRNKGTRKPTKTQRANEALKAEIVEYLGEVNGGVRCSAIADDFNVTMNKMSALLTQLVNDDVVERYIEKRITYFRLMRVDEPQVLEGEVTV